MVEIPKARNKPRLWIERLILYADTDPIAVIREIRFYPGLNIVLGIAQQARDDDDIPGMLTGHSVGKTLLCRLLRYCLGERTFGRKDAVEAIRHAFPKGAAGATIHVDDKTWSVLRPISNLGVSRASCALTLEELVASSQSECSYADFEKCLHEAFVKPLPSAKGPEAKEGYLWDHILAWLSRDQEVRYQSLWKWRSNRSDSQTPSFSRRKQDALFLIRMALGISEGRESELIQNIEKLKIFMKEKEARKNELVREPENLLRYSKRALRDLMGSPEHAVEDDDGLFGISSRVESFQKPLSGKLQKAKNKKRILDNSIAEYKALLRRKDSKIRKLKAAIEGVSESQEFPEEDNELQRIYALEDKECTIANIAIFECNHFQNYKNQLESEWNDLDAKRREKRAMEAAGDQGKALRRWLEERTDTKKQLDSIRKTIDQLENQRGDVEKEIEDLGTKLNLIEYNHTQWRKAKRLTEGETKDSEMSDIAAELETAKRELRSLESSLQNVQAKQRSQAKNLEGIYDKIIKAVLSQSYTGTILLPPNEDLAFVIRETAGNLTGEAVETLALVLADVAAMLWGAEGNGYHPCFLLHDSPREADLDRHIYSRFLLRVHELSKDLGGRQAPFQYILTTTTWPPKELHNEGTICLELEGRTENRLLFKKFFRKPEMF